MAKIIPFNAIRPVRDKAHLISSRPYFTYKKSILKAKLESNVFSFLHVINPEFRKGDKTKPNSTERFQAVSEKYIDFKNKNYFKKDEKPCFYIYRQTSSHGVYSGIIAGASIDDYQKNKIKKHENTIISREKLFKKYLDVCNFHAEPVLLTYSRTQKINEINEEIVKKRSQGPNNLEDEKIEASFIGTYLDFARVVNESNYPLGKDAWNNSLMPQMYSVVNTLASKMKRFMSCLNKYKLEGSKGCYSFFALDIIIPRIEKLI